MCIILKANMQIYLGSAPFHTFPSRDRLVQLLYDLALSRLKSDCISPRGRLSPEPLPQKPNPKRSTGYSVTIFKKYVSPCSPG